MIGEDNYHLNQLPKVLSFIALPNYLFGYGTQCMYTR